MVNHPALKIIYLRSVRTAAHCLFCFCASWTSVYSASPFDRFCEKDIYSNWCSLLLRIDNQSSKGQIVEIIDHLHHHLPQYRQLHHCHCACDRRQFIVIVQSSSSLTSSFLEFSKVLLTDDHSFHLLRCWAKVAWWACNLHPRTVMNQLDSKCWKPSICHRCFKLWVMFKTFQWHPVASIELAFSPGN